MLCGVLLCEVLGRVVYCLVRVDVWYGLLVFMLMFVWWLVLCVDDDVF